MTWNDLNIHQQLNENFLHFSWNSAYRWLVTFSFLEASWRSCVSISSAGSWTYLKECQMTIELQKIQSRSHLTTEPRMKQFLTLSMCGYRSGSVTLISVSLMFRYWSTLCNVPVMLQWESLEWVKKYWKTFVNKITKDHSWVPRWYPCQPMIWRTSRTTEKWDVH